MSLTQEDKIILTKWGVDVAKLEAAVKSDTETKADLPEVVVMKESDLEARDANKIAEGKRIGEKEGEVKGKELAAKSLKTKFGIEDDTKDITKVVDLVNEKVSTGDAGLKQQNELLIKDKAQLQEELQQEKNNAVAVAFDSRLIGMFPAKRTGDLRDDERLMIAKKDLVFEQLDGKTIVKRNGEILRDPTTQNPLAPEKVISDYFTERKWISTTSGNGGRGGGDNLPPNGGGGLKKLSQAQDEWKKEHPDGNIVSVEFQNYLESVTKDVADFDFYS